MNILICLCRAKTNDLDLKNEVRRRVVDEECIDGLHGTKKFSRDFYDRDSIYVDEISITRNNGHVRDNGERKRESPALFKEICLGRFRLVNNVPIVR